MAFTLKYRLRMCFVKGWVRAGGAFVDWQRLSMLEWKPWSEAARVK